MWGDKCVNLLDFGNYGYIYQTIPLYTLNIHNFCQLYSRKLKKIFFELKNMILLLPIKKKERISIVDQ